MNQCHPLSIQRQTSVKHSPVEMEVPAGTSPGLSSASALKVSQESTVKQVGFFQVGPTEPGLLGDWREVRSHPPAGQATQGKKTPKAVVTWRGGKNWVVGGIPESPSYPQVRYTPLLATAPCLPLSLLPAVLSSLPQSPSLQLGPTLWVFSRGGRLCLQPLPARRPV